MIRNLMIGAGLVALAAGAVAGEQGKAMADKEMTRAEVVAKVREHFAKFDTNKDGVIAKDEIDVIKGDHMAMRMEHGGPGAMQGMEHGLGDPNAAFDRLDTNKDGAISRDEFAKGRQVRIERRIVMKDGDGKDLAAADGKAMRRQMRMMHGGPGMGGHMIVMADSDHDGKITAAEAEAMALKHFDEMDANKDGKVTAEERKAARPMMMIKMRELHDEHAPKAS
ncbi:EF-hand domain-containing protein [Sphingomonas jaspsi]|uniref:EF-hand domain-containing protein n=1 Tax=Sphingomonas jaspsi TaxID=392409 RepID=UPI0004B3237B|nr:EF-hand domain-containing protein [Sphingomonas jaspsi]